MSKFKDIPNLSSIYKYDSLMGGLINIESGKKPLFRNASGYTCINNSGGIYMEHRVVWSIIYGVSSFGIIDHIDHNKNNNRIDNLREVTQKQNTKNKSLAVNNKSGFNGVYFDKYYDKWRSQISVDKKRINLGLFGCYLDAVSSRIAANKKYNYHQNHGF